MPVWKIATGCEQHQQSHRTHLLATTGQNVAGAATCILRMQTHGPKRSGA
jgi:hypothetical protein